MGGCDGIKDYCKEEQVSVVIWPLRRAAERDIRCGEWSQTGCHRVNTYILSLNHVLQFVCAVFSANEIELDDAVIVSERSLGFVVLTSGSERGKLGCSTPSPKQRHKSSKQRDQAACTADA